MITRAVVGGALQDETWASQSLCRVTLGSSVVRDKPACVEVSI